MGKILTLFMVCLLASFAQAQNLNENDSPALNDGYLSIQGPVQTLRQAHECSSRLPIKTEVLPEFSSIQTIWQAVLYSKKQAKQQPKIRAPRAASDCEIMDGYISIENIFKAVRAAKCSREKKQECVNVSAFTRHLFQNYEPAPQTATEDASETFVSLRPFFDYLYIRFEATRTEQELKKALSSH